MNKMHFFLQPVFLISFLMTTSFAANPLIGESGKGIGVIEDQYLTPDNPTSSKNKSPWNVVNATASSHPIAFKPGALAGTEIVAGDFLGVFTPEGLCAGVVEITDPEAGTAIMAFADDETTPEKDGFASGEMFIFRLFDQQQNEEFDLAVVYDPTLPNTSQFEVQGLSVVTAVTVMPTLVNEPGEIISGIYPNPSNGHFSLALSRWPDDLQIQVLDAKGNVLNTFTPGSKRNGSSMNLDLSGLQGGIYYLKLQHQNSVVTKKIVIN